MINPVRSLLDHILDQAQRRFVRASPQDPVFLAAIEHVAGQFTATSKVHRSVRINTGHYGPCSTFDAAELWLKSEARKLGRVDGRNQDQAGGEIHKCSVAGGGFFAAHGHALEPLQLAHGVLDRSPRLVACLWKNFGRLLALDRYWITGRNATLAACSWIRG